MRTLIILALLEATAAADDVAPRLTWILAGVGAGHIDGVSGMSAAWSMEFGAVHRSTLVGLELGMGWICPPGHDDCDGIYDQMIGLHARRRVRGSSVGAARHSGWWLGGGAVAHRIRRFPDSGPIEHGPVHWEPGVDLRLAYELRVDKHFASHFGLRAFAIGRDDDVMGMAKPVSQPRVGYGIDGGVVFEVGYIYGR